MPGHPVQPVAAAVAALVKPQPDFARARHYLGTRMKDCAAVPLQPYSQSCTPLAREALGTSRHRPLCRGTNPAVLASGARHAPASQWVTADVVSSGRNTSTRLGSSPNFSMPATNVCRRSEQTAGVPSGQAWTIVGDPPSKRPSSLRGRVSARSLTTRTLGAARRRLRPGGAPAAARLTMKTAPGGSEPVAGPGRNAAARESSYSPSNASSSSSS